MGQNDVTDLQIFDDHPLAFYFTPRCLQSLASAKVASLLWRHKMDDLNTWDHLTVSWFYDERFSCGDLLPVPSAIRDLIDESINQMAKRVESWVNNSWRDVFPGCENYEVVGKCIDCIEVDDDDETIVTKLLASEKVTSAEKYRLACKFFRKDDIERLWPRVCRNSHITGVTFEDDEVVYYWNCLMEGIIPEIPGDSNDSIDLRMISYDHLFNRHAIGYFWGKLSPDKQGFRVSEALYELWILAPDPLQTYVLNNRVESIFEQLYDVQMVTLSTCYHRDMKFLLDLFARVDLPTRNRIWRERNCSVQEEVMMNYKEIEYEVEEFMKFGYCDELTEYINFCSSDKQRVENLRRRIIAADLLVKSLCDRDILLKYLKFIDDTFESIELANRFKEEFAMSPDGEIKASMSESMQRVSDQHKVYEFRRRCLERIYNLEIFTIDQIFDKLLAKVIKGFSYLPTANASQKEIIHDYKVNTLKRGSCRTLRIVVQKNWGKIVDIVLMWVFDNDVKQLDEFKATLNRKEVALELWYYCNIDGALRKERGFYSIHCSDHKNDSLVESIESLVCSIARKVRDWVAYHRQYAFYRHEDDDVASEFFPKLIWQPNGAIDYEKTAMKLARDEKLDDIERYRLMCEYCLEDDIRTMWSRLRNENKLEDVEFEKTSFDGLLELPVDE
ncbi:hypothetical protein U1Q18_050373 [Sarracenia purpurea var. burkii]